MEGSTKVSDVGGTAVLTFRTSRVMAGGGARQGMMSHGKTKRKRATNAHSEKEVAHRSLEMSALLSVHPRSSTIVEGVLRELERYLDRNDQFEDLARERVAGQSFAGFYGAYRQRFALQDYITRLVHHTRCSDSAFIVALLYLRRVLTATPQLRVTSHSVHRLYMTSLVVAVKYLDDEVYANHYYAMVGGMTLAELNRLELELLVLLGFDCSVDPDIFAVLDEQVQMDEWCSEVSSLSQDFP
eukprot:CAMPEP_0184679998 /NCGR_PEP_ID=MMETSP0312-20130426/2862_1 /TAXON_ID=31354 /ORGANISM="Compsopogon coeruleus, Strain SAG 36.94" /LENGTH=241 /DNA_ID=CAMNT_0027129805 /DNA_START=578 /DNA_END=1303 /DNA_ORIENTATION=+